MSRSQTLTEYLIVLAVVIIIALIVVGVLGGIPGIGGNVRTDARNQPAAAKAVGISQFAASTGGIAFELRNNNPFPIKVHNITMDGELVPVSGFAYPFSLEIGEQQQMKTTPIFGGSPDGIATTVVTFENMKTGNIVAQSDELYYDVPNDYFSEGIIRYWSFEDNADDALGSGDSATLSGGAEYGDGSLGAGIYLKNSTSSVSFGTNTSFNLMPGRSISFWMKRENASCGNIISDGHDWTGTDGACVNWGAQSSYSIGVKANGFNYVFGGSGSFSTGTKTRDLSSWSHVVVAIDSANLHGYVDGTP